MITYNENADLSIKVVRSKEIFKSSAISKTLVASRLDRSKTSNWYKSVCKKENNGI